MNHLFATWCLIAVLASAGTARAQAVDDEKIEAGTTTYIDQLDTVIYSPFARASAAVAGEVEVDVHWNADVITSASVDVITAATDSIQETRNELGIGVARKKLIANTDLEAAYAYSFENDGRSHILSAGAKRGFAEDNYEVALGYSLTLNGVGLGGEPSSTWRSMTVQSLDVGLTRLVNPRTMVEVMYSLYWASGYQANPYRRVPIETAEELRGAIWVDEVVPDERLRNAVTARARRALGDRWFGTVEYRFYIDDWGVSAHTERASLAMELSPSLSLRVHQRAALQSGASFYEEHYLMETEYRTRDRRLSPHLSGMTGAAATWEKDLGSALGMLRVRLGYDALVWRYSEFSAPALSTTADAGMESLGWVLGHVIQLGAELQR